MPLNYGPEMLITNELFLAVIILKYENYKTGGFETYVNLIDSHYVFILIINRRDKKYFIHICLTKSEYKSIIINTLQVLLETYRVFLLFIL